MGVIWGLRSQDLRGRGCAGRGLLSGPLSPLCTPPRHPPTRGHLPCVPAWPLGRASEGGQEPRGSTGREGTLRLRVGPRLLGTTRARAKPSGFPAAPVLGPSPGWRLQWGWSWLPEWEDEADPVPRAGGGGGSGPSQSLFAAALGVLTPAGVGGPGWPLMAGTLVLLPPA